MVVDALLSLSDLPVDRRHGRDDGGPSCWLGVGFVIAPITMPNAPMPCPIRPCPLTNDPAACPACSSNLE
jgi:hypothetical protein